MTASIRVTDEMFTCDQLDCKRRNDEDKTFHRAGEAIQHNIIDNKKKNNVKCPNQLKLYNDDEGFPPCQLDGLHITCSFFDEIGLTKTERDSQSGKCTLYCQIIDAKTKQPCNHSFTSPVTFVRHVSLYHKLVPWEDGKNIYKRVKNFFTPRNNRVAYIANYSIVEKQLRSKKRSDAFGDQFKPNNIDQALSINGKNIVKFVNFIIAPDCTRIDRLKVIKAIIKYKRDQQESANGNDNDNGGTVSRSNNGNTTAK